MKRSRAKGTTPAKSKKVSTKSVKRVSSIHDLPTFWEQLKLRAENTDRRGSKTDAREIRRLFNVDDKTRGEKRELAYRLHRLGFHALTADVYHDLFG